jgi:hypothetical protein
VKNVVFGKDLTLAQLAFYFMFSPIHFTCNLRLKNEKDPILGFFIGNHVWQIGPPNHASTQLKN